MVPHNNIDLDTAPEGASCLKKSMKRVTFADDTTPTLTVDISGGARDSRQQPFVNLDTLGLKRSSRKRTLSILLKESESSSKGVCIMKKTTVSWSWHYLHFHNPH